MAVIKIAIPEGLDFADLKLRRVPETGEVEFDWDPIERICEASGVEIEIFRDSDEGNVAGLITQWYAEHRARGGNPDPVQEDIIAETMVEDSIGGGVSHEPGRA